jgi:hypothetical protein
MAFVYARGISHPVMTATLDQSDQLFHVDRRPKNASIESVINVLSFFANPRTTQSHHTSSESPASVDNNASSSEIERSKTENEDLKDKVVVDGQFGKKLVLTKKQFVHGAAQNNVKNNSSLLTPYERVHVALGHASHKTMMFIARHQNCIGLGLTLEEVNKLIPTACLACWLGKFSRLPAPASFFAKPAHAFEKIWYDLKGPFKVKSKLGHVYFLLVACQYSGYLWFFPLATKDEALDELRSFIAKHEAKIRIVASDSDSIFKSGKFVKWLDAKLIAAQFTAPYCHEGFIEAMMKIVMQAMKTIFASTHCPQLAWDFVGEAIVHTLNCTPTTKNPSQTPFHLVHGYTPDISHFVPIGVPCVFKSYLKTGVLAPNGEEGRVIGYSSQSPGAYVVLSKDLRILVRKDVQVDWNYLSRNDISLPKHLKKQLTQSLAAQPAELEDVPRMIRSSVDDSVIDYASTSINMNAPTVDPIMDSEDSDNETVILPEDASVSSDEEDSDKELERDITLDVEDDYVAVEIPDSLVNNDKVPKNKLVPLRVSQRPNKGVNKRYSAFLVAEDVIIFQLPPTPSDYKGAISKENPFRYWWIKAIKKEIGAIARADTYNEQPSMPSGSAPKALRSMLVFRVTRRSSDEATPQHTVSVAAKVIRDLMEGNKTCHDLSEVEVECVDAVFKFKARLVIKGCSSIKGVHFDKTFSPTIHFRSLLIVLHIQEVKRWVKSNIDMPNAYINAFVKKFILMLLPTQLTNDVPTVVQLIRNLYGMKDAGLLWYELMAKFLVEDLGFIKLIHDPCLFVRFSKESQGTEADAFIALYVDDLEIGGSDAAVVQDIKDKAEAKFGAITDLGQLTSYLGIEIVDVEGAYLSISQGQMLADIEKELDDSTPILMKNKKGRGQVVPTPIPNDFNPSKEANKINEGVRPILSEVGKLNYLANRSRIDLKYVCSVLALRANDAPESFLHLIGHVHKYLEATKDLFLRLGGEDEEIVLFGYADASYVKSTEGSLGYMGYAFFLGKDAGAISNAASKIKTACSSSTEAEVKALREALREVIWIRGLLAELGHRQVGPTTIYQDNKSTIELCENESSVNLSKHVMPLLAVIREAIKDKVVKLVYCPTDWMVADIHTSQAARGESYKILRMILMSGHLQAHKALKDAGKDLSSSPLQMMFR